jgi:hypothetical protein
MVLVTDDEHVAARSVVVPDPEQDWEHALQYQGGKRNPVQQYFTWEQAIGDFRLIGGLKPNLEDVARRLRLMIEPGHSAQLGPVDAAFFTIAHTGYAVNRYDKEPGVLVYLHRQDTDVSPREAFDRLLDVLGVDWHAVATIVDAEGCFAEPVLAAEDAETAAGRESDGTAQSV